MESLYLFTAYPSSPVDLSGCVCIKNLKLHFITCSIICEFWVFTMHIISLLKKNYIHMYFPMLQYFNSSFPLLYYLLLLFLCSLNA